MDSQEEFKIIKLLLNEGRVLRIIHGSEQVRAFSHSTLSEKELRVAHLLKVFPTSSSTSFNKVPLYDTV